MAKTGITSVLHPPYSSYLVLCDLSFLNLKLVLKGRRLDVKIQEQLHAALAEFQTQDFLNSVAVIGLAV
jgi:hypothetical protein